MNTAAKSARHTPVARRVVLTGGALAAFLTVGHTTIDIFPSMITALLPLIQARFRLTETVLAFLVATLAFSSSLIQPLVGALADRLGRRRVGALGLILTAALLSLVGVAPTTPVLWGLLLVGGLGSAAFHPVGASIARTAGGRHAGLAVGLFTTGGTIGVARDAPLIGWTLTAFSLAAALGGIGGAALGARVRRQALIPGAMLLALAPLLALFSLRPGTPLYFLAVVLAGGLINAGAPLLVVSAQDLAPRAVAAASGMLMGFSAGAAGVLYLGIGRLQELIGLAPAMRLAYLTLIPGAVVVWAVLTRYRAAADATGRTPITGLTGLPCLCPLCACTPCPCADPRADHAIPAAVADARVVARPGGARPPRQPDRGGAMTRFLRPAVALPALLGAVLLAALLTVGNVARVGALLRTFHPGYLLAILLVLMAYEAVQCAQWHVLLGALGIRAPLRAQAFAYLVGEPTRVLPIGNFIENYLLLRATGTDFGLSSAATLLSVLLEVAVSLLGLVVLGLGPWAWLRPLIIIGLGVFLFAAWAVTRRHGTGHVPTRLTRLTRHRRAQAALAEMREFRRGAAVLLHPGVLARGGVLGALYLLLGGSALYLVVRGLGGATVSWPQVLAVSFFSLAFALILPLPIDMGVTETGGVAAFLVLGVNPSVAVGAMLLLRALSVGVVLALALVTIAVLPAEVRALRRARPPTEARRTSITPPSPAEDPRRTVERAQRVQGDRRQATRNGDDTLHGAA